jgi:hypothetical protein
MDGFTTTPATPMTFEDSQRMRARDPLMDEAVRDVARLDFAMLKAKLAEEQRWTPETCNEVEGLYRKFLALNVRYRGRKICPTGPIDAFWHAHILDTPAYASDCEEIFGGMLHHFPYFGMRGPEDRAELERAFADTIELFIRHFGIDPTAGDLGDGSARSCRPQRCP